MNLNPYGFPHALGDPCFRVSIQDSPLHFQGTGCRTDVQYSGRNRSTNHRLASALDGCPKGERANPAFFSLPSLSLALSLSLPLSSWLSRSLFLYSYPHPSSSILILTPSSTSDASRSLSLPPSPSILLSTLLSRSLLDFLSWALVSLLPLALI